MKTPLHTPGHGTSQAQAGFSLVELMVAMVLGLILMAGVSRVYLGTKDASRTQDALARVQETGRFAVDLLKRDIRQADFWGCLRQMDSSNIANALADRSTNSADNFTDGGVKGADGGGSTPDTLTLRTSQGNGINVYGKMNNTSATIKVSKNSGLKEGEIVLLSDCTSGDIFQITNINGQANGGNKDEVEHNSGKLTPGNDANCGTGNSHCLSKNYDEDAQIYQPVTWSYEIKNDPNTGLPNLYRSGQPMLEGVENLQILYGEDTNDDGAADTYVRAGSVTDWNKVVSIRFAVLVRSIQPAKPQAVSVQYPLLDTSVTKDDRFLHQVFTDTVTIRNRAL